MLYAYRGKYVGNQDISRWAEGYVATVASGSWLSVADLAFVLSNCSAACMVVLRDLTEAFVTLSRWYISEYFSSLVNIFFGVWSTLFTKLWLPLAYQCSGVRNYHDWWIQNRKKSSLRRGLEKLCDLLVFQAHLIHLGAKYAPCMRPDERIGDKIAVDRELENHTACCISNDGKHVRFATFWRGKSFSILGCETWLVSTDEFHWQYNSHSPPRR